MAVTVLQDAQASMTSVSSYTMPNGADIPRNIVSWQVDAHRAVLLIHDMQRYFLNLFPRGVSPVTDLVANTCALRSRCASAGVPVIYTAQPGAMTTEERGLLREFWGPGMNATQAHREVIPELTPAAHDVIFTKWRYSAFHRSGLLDYLRKSRRDQLVICGVYAHVGCLMTAQDAFANDIQPFLVADAVADFSLSYHQLALNYAASRCAATVTTSAVVAALGGA